MIDQLPPLVFEEIQPQNQSDSTQEWLLETYNLLTRADFSPPELIPGLYTTKYCHGLYIPDRYIDGCITKVSATFMGLPEGVNFRCRLLVEDLPWGDIVSGVSGETVEMSVRAQADNVYLDFELYNIPAATILQFPRLFVKVAIEGYEDWQEPDILDHPRPTRSIRHDFVARRIIQTTMQEMRPSPMTKVFYDLKHDNTSQGGKSQGVLLEYYLKMPGCWDFIEYAAFSIVSWHVFKLAEYRLMDQYQVTLNVGALVNQSFNMLGRLRGGQSLHILQIRTTDDRAGSIRSLETTWGENGWHPHTHDLVFLNRISASVIQFSEESKMKSSAEWEGFCMRTIRGKKIVAQIDPEAKGAKFKGILFSGKDV